MLALSHIGALAMTLPYDDSHHHGTSWSDSYSNNNPIISSASCFSVGVLVSVFILLAIWASGLPQGKVSQIRHFQCVLRLRPRKVGWNTWGQTVNEGLGWDLNESLFIVRSVFYPLFTCPLKGTSKTTLLVPLVWMWFFGLRFFVFNVSVLKYKAFFLYSVVFLPTCHSISSPVLLIYNLAITLCKFKVYDVMTWYVGMYI